MSLFVTLSIIDTWQECHTSTLCYAECRDFLNDTLSVFMLNVVMLSVIMLNVLVPAVPPTFTL
jgi:hypothetical protein